MIGFALRTPRNDGGESQTDAPFALGRRRCSSSRGMISTKLQGMCGSRVGRFEDAVPCVSAGAWRTRQARRRRWR